MEKDLISMSRRERDVMKVMSVVLKGERTQEEAARLLGRSVRQIRRIQRRLEQQKDGGVMSLFATLPTGSNPFGLAFDGSGNLYAADYSTDQIGRITSGGVASLLRPYPPPPSLAVWPLMAAAPSTRRTGARAARSAGSAPTASP